MHTDIILLLFMCIIIQEEEKEDEDGKFSTKASSDAVTHLLFTTPTDLS